MLDKTYREYYELGAISLCEKTIYNAIHNSKIKDLKPYMLLMHYKKGKKYIFKEGKRINGDSIDLMPKEMFDRNIEGDLRSRYNCWQTRNKRMLVNINQS